MELIFGSLILSREEGSSDLFVDALRGFEYFTEHEKILFEFVRKIFDTSGEIPSRDYLFSHLPDVAYLVGNERLSISDFKVHLAKVGDLRRRQGVAKRLMDLASRALETDLTFDDVEQIRLDVPLGTDEEEADYGFDSFKKAYQDRKSRPSGLLTFIKPIDDAIGGMTAGSITVIAGFVGNMKSTMGSICGVRNAIDNNYNVLQISLEVPKEDMRFNILSYLATRPEFSDCVSITHDKIRKCILTEEEEEKVYNTLIPSLQSSRGQLFLLDETDFSTFSFGEIRQKLEKIDDLCIERTGSGLDAVFWDHCQLFQYYKSSNRSPGEVINEYISFIRRLSIAFRKDPKTKEYRKLSNIIISQVNREGYKRANKRDGLYDLLALSDANEVEKAASRVIFCYTTDTMKDAKELKLFLAKNRSGRTMTEPLTVFADGERYLISDDSAALGGMVSMDTIAEDFSAGASVLL